MLWTALLVALAVGSVISSPSSSELGDIIRRLEAAEAEITALKDNKAAQDKEIDDLKSLMSQVREIYKTFLYFQLAALCCHSHVFNESWRPPIFEFTLMTLQLQ